MRGIKFEIMFTITNKDFTKSIGKHYTTLDRLTNGDDTMNYADIEIIAKRQFTGLTDKNGVDIYEGDVLSHHKQGLCKVKYGNSHFDYAGYTLINQAGMVNTLQNPHIYEVIGNIHENPELCAVSKKGVSDE